MPECEHNFLDSVPIVKCSECGQERAGYEGAERLYRPAEVAEIVQIFTRWIFNPDAPVLVELGSRHPDIAAALRGKEKE